jgi:Galactose oxidase, central domain
MSFFRKKKEHTHTNSAPGNGLASQSQAGQQLQLRTKSQPQSRKRSPQQPQLPQPVHPWSAHTPPSGQWPSPFPRYFHALSTTATAASELFLFGGRTPADDRICNDLYVISTRNFSTTLLQTSGDVPGPRYGHRAVTTSTLLLIWGGTTDHGDPTSSNDDSLYLLNLGTSDLIHVKARSS